MYRPEPQGKLDAAFIFKPYLELFVWSLSGTGITMQVDCTGGAVYKHDDIQELHHIAGFSGSAADPACFSISQAQVAHRAACI